MLTHQPSWVRKFVAGQSVARLATVDPAGQPHLVPVVFVVSGRRLYTPIDGKKKSTNEVMQLRRVQNIMNNPQVCLLFDQYEADWSQLAWVQMRGTAALMESGPEYGEAIRLLKNKYPQYQKVPVGDWPVIVIDPQHVASWKAKK